MKQELIPFLYSTEDNMVVTVRTMKDIDNEVWFVAKDVCEVLDLSDTSKSCNRLDDDEKLVRKLFVSGQNRDVLLVNESGLYSLIFTSSKPEAKRFRKWVTSEVLPSIRRTGSYEAKPAVEEKSSRGIPQGVVEVAEKILKNTGLDDFQMALALDKVFQSYTGESILEIADIRAETDCNLDMDEKRMSWRRQIKRKWKHDYPQDIDDWGVLQVDEDGIYYPDWDGR